MCAMCTMCALRYAHSPADWRSHQCQSIHLTAEYEWESCVATLFTTNSDRVIKSPIPMRIVYNKIEYRSIYETEEGTKILKNCQIDALVNCRQFLWWLNVSCVTEGAANSIEYALRRGMSMMVKWIALKCEQSFGATTDNIKSTCQFPCIFIRLTLDQSHRKWSECNERKPLRAAD